MKNSILLLSIFTCLTITLTFDLNCEGIKFVEGYEDFSNISDYLPRIIKNIKESDILHGSIEIWEGNRKDGNGEIRYSPEINQVTLDFSDGDQYSEFLFQISEWELLKGGKGSDAEIKGFYVDSFSWSDGDHVRAKFEIQCKRMN